VGIPSNFKIERVMEKGGYVYILTNKSHRVLYIGMTNDIIRRLSEHRSQMLRSSFTSRYFVFHCIYYEYFMDIESAIIREKELKGWARWKKESLINGMNPSWSELFP
jgi:putative endonuclease